MPNRPTMVTLNASSDIFARCSKPETLATKSKFSASTISLLRLSRARPGRASVRFSSCCLLPQLGRSNLGREIQGPSRLCARCWISKRQFFSHDHSSVVVPTTQECVDRNNLQAIIPNESREAAPRPRHHGVFAHVLSSLAKMSTAGPCGPCRLGADGDRSRARAQSNIYASPPGVWALSGRLG